MRSMRWDGEGSRRAMSDTKPRVMWRTPEPRLSIELTRSWEPRMCVSKAVYRVKSSPYPLTDEQITALDRLGVIGSGQELRIVERKEWKVEAKAHAYDREGNLVDESPVDERGQPYPPSSFAVYQYDVARHCDSGD